MCVRVCVWTVKGGRKNSKRKRQRCALSWEQRKRAVARSRTCDHQRHDCPGGTLRFEWACVVSGPLLFRRTGLLFKKKRIQICTISHSGAEQRRLVCPRRWLSYSEASAQKRRARTTRGLATPRGGRRKEGRGARARAVARRLRTVAAGERGSRSRSGCSNRAEHSRHGTCRRLGSQHHARRMRLGVPPGTTRPAALSGARLYDVRTRFLLPPRTPLGAPWRTRGTLRAGLQPPPLFSTRGSFSEARPRPTTK